MWLCGYASVWLCGCGSQVMLVLPATATSSALRRTRAHANLATVDRPAGSHNACKSAATVHVSSPTLASATTAGSTPTAPRLCAPRRAATEAIAHHRTCARARRCGRVRIVAKSPASSSACMGTASHRTRACAILAGVATTAPSPSAIKVSSVRTHISAGRSRYYDPSTIRTTRRVTSACGATPPTSSTVGSGNACSPTRKCRQYETSLATRSRRESV